MPRDYYAEMSPQAEDREKFDRMVTFFRTAGSQIALKQMTMMYTLDHSYSRSDIMLAMGTVEREKGWHV